METMTGVDHPVHYNSGGVECIDAMVSAFGLDATVAFCKLNAFKYIWRAGKKTDGANLKKDLEKAQWYINWIIQNTKDNG